MRKMVIVFCLITLYSKGQDPHGPDSLYRQLLLAKDMVKAQVLIELADVHKKTLPDSCIYYAKQSLQLAAEMNDKKGEAVALNYIGLGYKNKGDLKKAIGYYIGAVNAWRDMKSPAKEAAVLVNIGNAYRRLDMLDSALFYQLLSLRIRERLGDESALANSYKGTGDVYYRNEKFGRALEYYRKAETIYARQGDTAMLGSVKSDIGLLLYEMSRYEESIHILNESMSMYERAGDEEGIGFVHNNLALSYQRLEKFDEALAHYKAALLIKEKLRDKKPVANTLFNIGNTYYDMGKYRDALMYLNMSLDIGIATGSLEIKKSCYEMLAKCNAATHHFKEAFAFNNLFMQVKDSIFNKESVSRMEEMQARYESEKKDMEISRKTLELQNSVLELNKKKIQLFISIALAFMVMLLGILLYNRYRLKQKQFFDAEVIRQQELRNKAIIDAEERERIRIARDLHDGIGQQLSAVKMNLSAYESGLPNNSGEEKEKLHALIHLVDESVKEVRDISHSMMPNALIRSGLATAIREFINKISSTDAFRVDLQIIGLTGRLDGITEAVLYRVLQECISNIIRHAGATEISIQLIRHEDHLNLMVEDNGKGFATDTIGTMPGMGLRNIVSRIQYLNGTVEFDSTPGKGTTVNIQVPL